MRATESKAATALERAGHWDEAWTLLVRSYDDEKITALAARACRSFADSGHVAKAREFRDKAVAWLTWYASTSTSGSEGAGRSFVRDEADRDLSGVVQRAVLQQLRQLSKTLDEPLTPAEREGGWRTNSKREVGAFVAGLVERIARGERVEGEGMLWRWLDDLEVRSGPLYDQVLGVNELIAMIPPQGVRSSGDSGQ